MRSVKVPTDCLLRGIRCAIPREILCKIRCVILCGILTLKCTVHHARSEHPAIEVRGTMCKRSGWMFTGRCLLDGVHWTHFPAHAEESRKIFPLSNHFQFGISKLRSIHWPTESNVNWPIEAFDTVQRKFEQSDQTSISNHRNYENMKQSRSATASRCSNLEVGYSKFECQFKRLRRLLFTAFFISVPIECKNQSARHMANWPKQFFSWFSKRYDVSSNSFR